MRRTGTWLGALALLSTFVIVAPAHAATTVSIKDDNAVLSEGDSGTSKMIFKVVLSSSPAKTVKVDYKTIETNIATGPLEDDAKQGQDFVFKSGTVTFLPGDKSQSVKIPVVGDLRNEKAYEYFAVKLSDPVRATMGVGKGLGLIYNDDPLPNFIYSDESTPEGTDLDTNSIQVDVTLTEASGRQVKLDWWVEDDFDDNSGPDGVDYTSGSGTLTWQPGQTTKSFNIPITPDDTDEDDQVVGIGFGAQINAAMDIDHSHEATIEDDDDEPTVSVGNGSGVEGDEPSLLEMPLIWSAPTEKTVGGSWSIVHVTTDESDFFSFGGSLSYGSSLGVGVSGDNTDEANETFTVTLDGTPTNVSYGSPTSATGTINDDD